jgi:hypothetical protein
MRLLRNIQILGSVFWLSIAHANAVQINLSGDYIDRYFRILEDYVLPLMVVSTVVLFCGYLASRVYHRTVTPREPRRDDEDGMFASAEDGTAAFLRELKATPPISDPEPDQEPGPKREPRIRAQHPLLRKRAANAAAALRARNAAGEEARFAPAPEMPAPALDRYPAPKREEAPPPPRPEAPAMRDAAGPRLGASLPAETMRERETAAYDRETVPDSLRAERVRGEPPREPEAAETAAAKVDPPPVATSSIWWQEPGGPQRMEPSASVVQALKKSAPPSPDLEAARARAGEVVDSLDYIASVLQQGNTLIAERIKAKHGLTLEEVRGIRITGFDQPQGVQEDLRKLGGDAASEVLAAYAAVLKFNHVLRRLEQMAADEPLDEGWNDLLRARMSEMLFVVGQVRKTLGGYRRGTKLPANTADKLTRPGDASGKGPDHPLPLGRRQL